MRREKAFGTYKAKGRIIEDSDHSPPSGAAIPNLVLVLRHGFVRGACVLPGTTHPTPNLLATATHSYRGGPRAVRNGSSNVVRTSPGEGN